MTSDTTNVSEYAVESGQRHHGDVHATKGSFARLTAAIAATVLTILVSETTALHFAGWHWVALAVVSVLALLYSYRLHLSAVAQVVRGAPRLDVLASTAIVTTYLWAAFSIRSDEAGSRIAVATLVAALVIVSEHIRALSDPANDDGEAPRWLVPGVLVVALLTLAVRWALDEVSVACSAAIAVLVVACSAALALATPAALLIGTKRGATLGLRFGGMAALDAARRIDTIVLDKYRTVTTGNLKVVSVDPIDPEHDRNMRWFAGALERSSDHPIGRAIAKLAAGHGRVTNVDHQPGSGVSGAVDRHPVRVGRPSWIGLEAPEGVGWTVAVEVDGRALGCITVADAVRPHAGEAVAALRVFGLEPVLLSDGNRMDTEHLATEVGIDTYFADLDADKRPDLIMELQQRGHTVAMVGDRGTNAGALAIADLAITRVNEADDAEAQGGIVVSDIDVSIVAEAIRLSRATLARAEANRRFALAAILIPVPFASLSLISPLFAAVIATTGTAVVGVNSLRLRIPASSQSPAA